MRDNVMAIVCRKCNYHLTEDEITAHCSGAMFNFIQKIVDFFNNLLLLFIQLNRVEEIKTRSENTFLGIANQQKIICPKCFEYNGWIIVS